MISTWERLTLPTFRQICNDLGSPSAARLGRFLGVHPRTVERWKADDWAPRPVLLGLFWLTTWGQSELNCELHNRSTLYGSHLAAVEHERDALRRELARVLAAGDFGAANRPTFRPALEAPPIKATGTRSG